MTQFCTWGGRSDGIYPVSIPRNLLQYRDSFRPCRELSQPTRADGVYDEGVQEGVRPVHMSTRQCET